MMYDDIGYDADSPISRTQPRRIFNANPRCDCGRVADLIEFEIRRCSECQEMREVAQQEMT